jgi:hypothetical protein
MRLVIPELIFKTIEPIMCPMWLLPNESVLLLVDTTSIEAWHILVGVWVSVIIFLSENWLLLLWSSINALLLINHKWCLSWLILVLRLIKVWEMWLIIVIKGVLPLLESNTSLLTLALLLIYAIWCPRHIIQWLLLLLMIGERVHWRLYNWFRIFKGRLSILLLTSLHHVYVLRKPTRLHECGVLIIRSVLSLIFVVQLPMVGLLRSCMLIGCESLVMS